nr:hypothetical protein [Tanacetum cinerariifolium]
MQTRSSSRLASNQSSNLTSSTNPNPKGRNRRRSKQRIKNLNLDNLSSPVVTMADQRTMAQLLQAPTGLLDCFELKDANACHLKISAIILPAWKGHLDNQMDLELLDLHDRCYTRQAVVDNAVNRRAREFLQIIEKMNGEADVIKNPAVLALREKISSLTTDVTGHKGMPILSGRKSVPLIIAMKKGEMERKTTQSSRELHGKELI